MIEADFRRFNSAMTELENALKKNPDAYSGPMPFTIGGLESLRSQTMSSWRDFTNKEVYGNSSGGDKRRIPLASMNHVLTKLYEALQYDETADVATFMRDQLVMLDFTRLLYYAEKRRLRTERECDVMEVDSGNSDDDHDDDDHDADAADKLYAELYDDHLAEELYLAVFEKGELYRTRLLRDVWDVRFDDPCADERDVCKVGKKKKRYKPVQFKMSAWRDAAWMPVASFDASGQRAWEFDVRRLLHQTRGNALLIELLARSNGKLRGILPQTADEMRGMHSKATFNANLAMKKKDLKLPRTPQKPRGMAERPTPARPWLSRK